MRTFNFPLVNNFDEGDVLLKDGINGTKTILAADAIPSNSDLIQVTDLAGNFASKNVEGVLSEIGTQLADITPRVETIEGLVDDLANGGVDTTARADIARITGCEIIPLTTGEYYVTNGSTVNIVTPSSNGTWASKVVACVEKNVFTITGVGGASPRLWCFLDSNKNVLTVAGDSAHGVSLEITAPKNAAYLVVNVIIANGYLIVKGRQLSNLFKIESYANKDHIKHRVIVDANGHGDYTTIQAAYTSIADSSFENQYEVVVFPGTYNENNLIPPAYTHTHGLHPNSVVITSYGLNTTYSVIDQRFWSSKLSNFTIISYTKYCIHYDESLQWQTLVNENLHLIQTRTANQTIIGGGSFGNGVRYVWNNCVFEGGEVHCHTSGTQQNYNNTHDIFNNCKLRNASYYAQSSGAFGYAVFEINGTNTKLGNTTLKINLTQALRTTNEPWSYYANGCEWQILGSNNKNMLVNFVLNTGEGLVFETANANENVAISGTAVADLFGFVRYKKGGSRTKGTATGICLVKDEKAAGTTDVYQMWKRLGDCSVINKTLSVTVGATTQTYTFDQNYLTAKTAETDLLAAVNAIITAAVLKKYVATDAWDNVELEEKQYITVTDTNDILKGCAVGYDGKNAPGESAASAVYGISLEGGVNGEAIPVWIGNVLKTALADGEYGVGTNGALSTAATAKIGKVASGIFYRY